MKKSDQDNIGRIYDEIKPSDVKTPLTGAAFAREQELDCNRLQRELTTQDPDASDKAASIDDKTQ